MAASAAQARRFLTIMKCAETATAQSGGRAFDAVVAVQSVM
jgi:gamma-glutamyltranspeptidase